MVRRKKITLEERLAEPKSQIRKLNNMLKNIRDMTRRGSMCEDELNKLSHQLRTTRDLYKVKIKVIELEYEIHHGKQAS